MSKLVTVINATTPAGLAIMETLLTQNPEITIVAQADGNLQALAPLASTHKGRIISYQADLSDPASAALFIRDAKAYSGTPACLVLIFPGLPPGAEMDVSAALQQEAGSCYEICRAFFPAMAEMAGRVVFLTPEAEKEPLEPLRAMADGALRALIHRYREQPGLGLTVESACLSDGGVGERLLKALAE